MDPPLLAKMRPAHPWPATRSPRANITDTRVRLNLLVALALAPPQRLLLTCIKILVSAKQRAVKIAGHTQQLHASIRSSMQRYLSVATRLPRPLTRGLASHTQHGIFVGGAYRVPENAQFFAVENPAKAQVIAECVAATPRDVHDAIERAHRVFLAGEWSRTDVRHRANVMQKIATLLRDNLAELADLEVLQTGRSVRWACPRVI